MPLFIDSELSPLGFLLYSSSSPSFTQSQVSFACKLVAIPSEFYTPGVGLTTHIR